MTDAKIDAEARKNADFKYDEDERATAYFAFLDGVAWMNKNPSPEVAELANLIMLHLNHTYFGNDALRAYQESIK